MKNVLEYLEYNAAVNADKIAASDYVPSEEEPPAQQQLCRLSNPHN